MNWGDRLLIWAVLAAVPLVLVVFPLYLLFGGLRSFARRPLERCFRNVPLRATPEPGDVLLEYHTYRGLLFWSLQEMHRGYARAADAEELLKRLLRFNLTWGLLSYGLLFVPWLALAEYRAQRNSILAQRQSLSASNEPTP